MTENYSWHCPFCNTTSVVTPVNNHKFTTRVLNQNKYGSQVISGEVVICANPECEEISLGLAIGDEDHSSLHPKINGQARHSWLLIPDSMAKIYPDYIPAPLRQDYTEACLIVQKSPKASATLSRRCLQGMIRDFWKVEGKKSLYQEIEDIKEKIEYETWEAIDSLRRLGNIGAHMERDINIIVDVDEDEASLLIQLIETLFDEWYVRRHVREQRMAKIKMVAAEKDAARKGASQGDS